MSSRRGKTPLLGKTKNKTYGTTIEIDSSTDSSSSNRDYFNNSDLVDQDEIDFAAWNPEQIPLLQRTIDQARSLGVRRTLSWVAGNHMQVCLTLMTIYGS